MTLNASLHSEMKSLLLVVITSSVCLSAVPKGENHHNRKVLNVRKPSKVKLRYPFAKRGRISTSRKPSGGSHEEAYHYIIETAYRNHNDDAKKKRKHRILKIPTKEDYQNDELESKCSVKAGTKKKQQLDIPGCGGWVKLACPGGCLAIHKVSRHKYFYNLRGSQDKGKIFLECQMLISLLSHVACDVNLCHSR